MTYPPQSYVVSKADNEEGLMMDVDEGRAVLGSGVLHFHNTENAETQTSPNVWFGQGSGFNAAPVRVSALPGGVAVAAYLAPGERFAGIQSFEYESRPFKVYCVIDRVAELSGGPMYEVRYSLTEG